MHSRKHNGSSPCRHSVLASPSPNNKIPFRTIHKPRNDSILTPQLYENNPNTSPPLPTSSLLSSSGNANDQPTTPAV